MVYETAEQSCRRQGLEDASEGRGSVGGEHGREARARRKSRPQGVAAREHGGDETKSPWDNAQSAGGRTA